MWNLKSYLSTDVPYNSSITAHVIKVKRSTTANSCFLHVIITQLMKILFSGITRWNKMRSYAKSNKYPLCMTGEYTTQRLTSRYLASPEEKLQQTTKGDNYSTADGAHHDIVPRDIQQPKLSTILKQTWQRWHRLANLYWLQTEKHKKCFFLNVCCVLVLCLFLCCSMCLFLYGPFWHGALKLDISTLFTKFFLWTSLQFILHW